MRISDWSSDVCSSDLATSTSFPQRVGRLHLFWPMLRCPGCALSLRRCRGPWHQYRLDSLLLSGSLESQHPPRLPTGRRRRSEEHTSELQSLMRISYAVFCLKKQNTYKKFKNKP